MADRLTNEELRAKWDRKDLSREEQVEALVRLFGMPRDRAVCEVEMLWKNEIPGAYDTRDEQPTS